MASYLMRRTLRRRGAPPVIPPAFDGSPWAAAFAPALGRGTTPAAPPAGTFSNVTFAEGMGRVLDAPVFRDGSTFLGHPSYLSVLTISAAGRLVGTRDANALMTVQGKSFADVAVSSVLQAVSANNAATGVAARVQTANTCIIGRYHGGNNAWDILERTNSADVTRGTPYSEDWTTGTREVRLEVQGTTARLYVDNVLRITATVTLNASGLVGVWNDPNAPPLPSQGYQHVSFQARTL